MLAVKLSPAMGVVRGSLLQRTIRHSSGCLKCARGEGHLLWVLTVGYPGGKTRQVSLRPDQVPLVGKRSNTRRIACARFLRTVWSGLMDRSQNHTGISYSRSFIASEQMSRKVRRSREDHCS